ncbi:3-oxoacyl-ACP reductase FabG [Thiohalocapsa sp. ML1]|uniref:3-oxoacyl-ACP reductase FabG n=1 Tax=Thiohalocapsa sp. ML1 TaxID=1431688 RepID=UPI000732387A|nr:3-oxoacyl-ACP reductase FabG [Thiohalocapsa sp. ML1]
MLDGEVALVTGASRGIGRAIAESLLAQGAAVAGTATTAAGAARIADELAGEGRKVIGLELNVTDAASIEAALASAGSAFGVAPGILVNNAGITRDGLLMRMQEADWDAVIATNLTSVFRLTKACLRSMTKARKGRIINISSVVGATGNAGQANYAAAKAGMIGFTKSLAREVGSRGITVNCVAPGFIDTDMTRALGDEQRQALLGSIPLGRLGAAADIAAAVAFLASPAAGYITGETIHVNGGMYMA